MTAKIWIRNIGSIWPGVLILALTACGGSGGIIVIGGPKVEARPFTSFSEVDAGQDYVMEAETRSAGFTTNQAGQVTSVDASETNDGKFTFALNGSGGLTRASLSTPLFAFDIDNGDAIVPGDLVDPVATGHFIATSVGLNEIAVISDQNIMGFEYQSFGVWLSGIAVGPGTIAVMTAGAATPTSGVPDTGGATYNGSSTGVYVDPVGDSFFTFADFSAIVDFGTTAMSVASTNTQVLNTASGLSSANADLNYVGSGTVARDGTFETAITATGLAGDLDGKLYGPSAEELGGTFDMIGLNGRHIGAVGADQ